MLDKVFAKLFNKISDTPLPVLATKGLHEAAKNGDLKMIKRALAYGAVVDEEDTEGMTAFYYASSWGRPDLIECLLEAGADVNVDTERTGKRGTHGTHPFIGAALRNEVDMLRLMVKYNVDVNMPDSHGESSALHRAVQRRKIEAVTFLVEEAKAALDTRFEGATPLDLATAFGGDDSHDMALILVKNGADPFIPDALGNSAYSRVVGRRGWEDVVTAIEACKAIKVAQEKKNEAPPRKEPEALQKDLVVGHPLVIRRPR